MDQSNTKQMLRTVLSVAKIWSGRNAKGLDHTNATERLSVFVKAWAVRMSARLVVMFDLPVIGLYYQNLRVL